MTKNLASSSLYIPQTRYKPTILKTLEIMRQRRKFSRFGTLRVAVRYKPVNVRSFLVWISWMALATDTSFSSKLWVSFDCQGDSLSWIRWSATDVVEVGAWIWHRVERVFEEFSRARLIFSFISLVVSLIFCQVSRTSIIASLVGLMKNGIC